MHPQQVCTWHQAERCSRYTGRKGNHPEGPGQAGEVVPCEPNEVQQGQVQGVARAIRVFIWTGRRNPKEQPCKRRSQGSWWTRSWTWASSMRLQPGMPTVFWPALKKGWPAGRGRWLSPSTWLLRSPIWCTGVLITVSCQTVCHVNLTLLN